MIQHITENGINKMLQQTRITADLLEARGSHALGLMVLRTGSMLAELQLKLIPYHKRPFQCGEMGHILKDRASQEFYIHTGVCLHCDHLRSDEMDDREEMKGAEL